jgi:hypothetical protein
MGARPNAPGSAFSRPGSETPLPKNVVITLRVMTLRVK